MYLSDDGDVLGMRYDHWKSLAPRGVSNQAVACRSVAVPKALSSQAYKDLSVQSMNVAPFTYSSVEPGLFDKIVRQELPPGGPVATVLQWLCRVRLGPKREAMPYSNPSIDTLAVVISVGHAIDQSLPNSSRTTT